MKPWPTVSLGELLRLERRPVKVEPEKLYQEIGIYCFGRGIFHKTPRTGFEVGDKDLFLMKQGDFILQVTFAWEGAIAIVSAAEDGMFGSTRYPTFRVDESRCVPHFLLNYFKTEEGLQQLIKICPGSAGRNRVLSMRRIPEVLVPLPPLAEQQQVVARIHELEAQIRNANFLRQQVDQETGALLQSRVMAIRSNGGWQEKSLGEVCDILDRLRKPVNSSERASRQGAIPYYGAGRQVGWIDNHLFDEELVLLAEDGGPFDWRCAYLIRGKTWVNNHAHVLRGTGVSNKWLLWMLKSTDLQPYLSGSTRGKLPQGEMKTIPIPVPALPEQHRIVSELDALQAEMDALKCLQAETAAELDALLPAVLDRAFKGELR